MIDNIATWNKNPGACLSFFSPVREIIFLQITFVILLFALEINNGNNQA